MPRPVAAIVGRPNVGKSTLVNRLAVTKQAIVDVTAGVTRDRNYVETDWRGREFILIDTGGLEPGGKEPMVEAIRAQAMAGISEADLILFVVDAKSGLTPVDEEIADILRKSKKPLLLVVNKADNPDDQSVVAPFYKLGLGDPQAISASQGLMIGDLLDDIVERLPVLPEEEPRGDELRIAIVGRPNAGKSSIFNRVIGAERAVVSEIPGTTRDAIDTVVSRGDRRYRFIDTAGLRRVAKLSGSLEYYGILRAVRALESASVALLVVDGSVGVTDQDQRIAGLADEKHCGLIVLLNKWDTLDEEGMEALEYGMATKLHFADYALVLKTSAATGRGVKRIYPAIDQTSESFNRTISTSALNRFLTVLRSFRLPTKKGRELKLKYATQLRTGPPAFLIFVNDPKLVDNAYKRFFKKKLREEFDLKGTPVSVHFRKDK
jgi:GTPase